MRPTKSSLADGALKGRLMQVAVSWLWLFFEKDVARNDVDFIKQFFGRKCVTLDPNLKPSE